MEFVLFCINGGKEDYTYAIDNTSAAERFREETDNGHEGNIYYE